MIPIDDAALRRLKKTVQKRVFALSLLFLLPGLTSACRNTFSTSQLLKTPDPYSEVASRHPEQASVQPNGTADIAPIWGGGDKADAAQGFVPKLPIIAEMKETAKADEVVSGECIGTADVDAHLFYLPEKPVSHSPIRIVATTRRVSSEPMNLVVRNGEGEPVTSERLESWGYTPRAVSAYFLNLPPGKYDVRFSSSGNDGARDVVCGTLSVHDNDVPSESVGETSGVWEVRHDWSPAFEDLYSVFVAKLFYVRPGGKKGWRPLHQATRDPFRNILYGMLGFDEDGADAQPRVKLEPDCADAPYQLRAYFAWKMGLPFMFNRCLRGSSLTGPRCLSTHGNRAKRFDNIPNPVDRFNAFADSHVGWKVHSGNGRTLPESNDGDLYPIPLTPETLRPGAVFVDAGGHVILVSQVEPQTESRIGALWGVDAHPDRTVTHKQFGMGTFVFNHHVPTDGFKVFRPSVRGPNNLRFLDNEELAQRGFVPVSSEQSEITNREAFYRGVSRQLNPTPLDPVAVLENKLDVLHGALLERVEAVALGVAYMKEHNWREMAMPAGPAIFETTGPWEIYSTPARDLRCFLAMDDVMSFPEKAVKERSEYLVDSVVGDNELKRTLEEMRAKGLAERSIVYERSDGSKWELTLKDVVDRQETLEMAYNPNDCIETRWGARDGSPEKATCNRKAPPDQRFKMKLARRWFSSRRRPDQR